MYPHQYPLWRLLPDIGQSVAAMISEAAWSAIASCVSAFAALVALGIARAQALETRRANETALAERRENLAKETRRAASALLEEIDLADTLADELVHAYNVLFNDAGSFGSSAHDQVIKVTRAIKDDAVALRPYAERVHAGQVALTGALVDEHANMLTRLEGDLRKVRAGTTVILRNLNKTNTSIQVDRARKDAEHLALALQSPLK